METRLIPRKGILLAATRSNKGFLGPMDHGISETSLRSIYSFLDLDEVLSFAAVSWRERNKGNQKILEGDFPEAFYKVTSEGLDWLEEIRFTNRPLSKKQRQLQERLNPFNGEGLIDRLRMINPSSFYEFKRVLQQETKKYVTEAQHRYCQRHGIISTKEIVVMGGNMPFRFKGANPKKIVEAYAAHSANILRKYPVGHVDFEPVRPLVQGNFLK